MASVLHGSARTTLCLRAEFQASKRSTRALATRYGVNPKTVGIRAEIAAAGVEAVIPAESNCRIPIPNDREKYRWRNLVERLFSKLKNWRRVATRYDKTKEPYLGFVALASIELWIPFVHDAYAVTASVNCSTVSNLGINILGPLMILAISAAVFIWF